MISITRLRLYYILSKQTDKIPCCCISRERYLHSLPDSFYYCNSKVYNFYQKPNQVMVKARLPELYFLKRQRIGFFCDAIKTLKSFDCLITTLKLILVA